MYRRPDSNRHGHLNTHWILSPTCLPIPPLRQKTERVYQPAFRQKGSTTAAFFTLACRTANIQLNLSLLQSISTKKLLITLTVLYIPLNQKNYFFMKRFIAPIVLFLIIMSSPIYAQLEIGASYELRDEDPQSGFGLRIEKGFLEQLPLAQVSMRAHFSFFSEENNVDEGGISYSEELTNYDFGVAIIGGVSVGLMEPYIGLGLGSTTLDINRSDVVGIPADEEEQNESNIYWNGIIGAKVTIIPILKPFVEFRYSDTSLSEPEVAEVTTGRIIFGVSLSF